MCETPGQALVHESVLPASPMKNCRSHSMNSLSLSDPQHSQVIQNFSGGRRKAVSTTATHQCRVIFQLHPMRFAQWPLGFLRRGQWVSRVKILQGCSLRQNSFVSSVAISLLWAAWSRGSCVIPGSYTFAPSEGHCQGLSVTSRMLTLFITHPSGSARVRERTALYLWIPLPAGAGDFQ